MKKYLPDMERRMSGSANAGTARLITSTLWDDCFSYAFEDLAKAYD
jgi:hypothetical protein